MIPVFGGILQFNGATTKPCWVYQFNLLMNKAAMNLASSFSFNYGGNIYFSSYEDFWQQAIRASVIILAKARGRMVEWAA